MTQRREDAKKRKENQMPSVNTFWQLPEEEEKILAYLETTGRVVAIANCWMKRKKDLEPQPIRSFIADRKPTRFYFGLLDYLSDISFKRSKYEGEWGFKGPDYMQDCLIAYSRPYFAKKGKLALSNLAAQWYCLDESQTKIVDKDPEFIRWGKKVFAWSRRFASERHDSYRATKEAKHAIDQGIVEAVLY